MKLTVRIFIYLLLFGTLFSCTQTRNDKEEKKKELRFNWSSSQILKNNDLNSTYNYLRIAIEIVNPTDSFFYLSKKHGDFIIKNRKSQKVDFIETFFNSMIIHPHSNNSFKIKKSYLKIEKPSIDDFDFDLYYELNGSVFDKKTFYENINPGRKRLIDTTRLFLPDNKYLFKTRNYKFEDIDNMSKY